MPQSPRLADGVELVGEYEGSGYKEPHHLARRSNGALVQLTALLHLIAAAADGHNTFADIAREVSAKFGQTVTEDNVRQLVEDKLRPLGVLADADGKSPDVPPPDPLLALKFRCTLLSEGGSRALTTIFEPLFLPFLVVGVLAGLAAFDVWLFVIHGLAQGLRQTVQQPVIFLFIVGCVVVSAALHEIGHASGCRYGGAQPGRMGAGIYVAWPAFYTDVTDAYRLDRRGKLRTDLGGVYFNAIVVLVGGAAFFATGWEPLLLVCFALQMQIVQQLLPLLRLDGYYILSDLVGVPDLFKRIGPILRSSLPWKKIEPSVLELKRHVRVVVTLWVLAIIPLLLFNLGFVVFNAPRILATAWDSAAHQWHTIQTSSGLARAVGVLQLLILCIPTLGTVLTIGRVGRRSAAGAWGWSSRSPVRRLSVFAGSALLLVLLALAWWPDGRVTPYRPGERGTVIQGVQDLSSFRQGSPLLRSPDDAATPLPAVREGASAVSGAAVPGTDPTTPNGPSTAPTGPAAATSPTSGARPTSSPSTVPSRTPASNPTSSSPSTSLPSTTATTPSAPTATPSTSNSP